jgi:uncharacterized small protein (DUF1192 family)
MKNEIARFGDKNPDTQTLITESDIIMRGGAAAAAAAPDFTDIAAPNPVNKKILRIIDDGINGIIINIKAIVGNTNLDVDQQYTNIIAMLNSVNNPLILKINPIPTEKGDFIDTKRQNADRTAIVIDNLQPVSVSTHKEQIQNRLNNCHHLENHYIKKHNELITAFDFIRKLFDKYKYAIKLVLYLLKSLKQGNEPVKVIDKTEDNERLKRSNILFENENNALRAENERLKNTTPPDIVKVAHLTGEVAQLTGEVARLQAQLADTGAQATQDVQLNLPPALISNIAKLITDQTIIQTNINDMKAALNNEKLTELETTAEKL